VAEFCSARSNIISPPQWTSLSQPFTREAYELDCSMFSGDINVPLNGSSYKVKLGFGSIAKYAYNRQNIYKTLIPFNESLIRLEKYYFPIHAKLQELLSDQFDQYGYSLLVDCHSMPS
jgi:N-formylglutamate amidohydrolase